jgi:protein-S-isoprenylcysteine O-methyltransferase Ste14
VKRRLPPPKYLNLVIGLQVVLHFMLPIRRVIFWPYSCLGLVFIALGAVINVWAVRLLQERNTTLDFHGQANAMVTDGPYRISRNPVYLGGVLVSLGLAILLGSLIAFVFPVTLFWILDGLYVRLEEPALLTRFGARYLDYKRKVRRWF